MIHTILSHLSSCRFRPIQMKQILTCFIVDQDIVLFSFVALLTFLFYKLKGTRRYGAFSLSMLMTELYKFPT